MPFDGIESVEADGSVVFTAPAVEALTEILGRRIESMSAEEAPDIAAGLVERLG